MLDLKILLTNWINLASVFLLTLAFYIVDNLTKLKPSFNFLQAMFEALFLILAYGMLFWGLFIILLVVLDLILIIPNQKYLKIKLFVEWLIISSPTAYFTVRYNEWIFVAAMIAFFIGQQLREKRIKLIQI